MAPETVEHFLLRCDAHVNIRRGFEKKISNVVPGYTMEGDSYKLSVLLMSRASSVQLVGLGLARHQCRVYIAKLKRLYRYQWKSSSERFFWYVCLYVLLWLFHSIAVCTVFVF